MGCVCVCVCSPLLTLACTFPTMTWSWRWKVSWRTAENARARAHAHWCNECNSFGATATCGGSQAQVLLPELGPSNSGLICFPRLVWNLVLSQLVPGCHYPASRNATRDFIQCEKVVRVRLRFNNLSCFSTSRGRGCEVSPNRR